MHFDRRIGIAGLGLSTVSIILGAKVAEMPVWVVFILFGLGCLLMGAALGGILGRPRGQSFGNLLSAVERLCAEEAELGLRGRFSFADDRPEHRIVQLTKEQRAQFRATLQALESPCEVLGLTTTLAQVRDGVRTLAPEIAHLDVSQARDAFLAVSRSLKVELADKYRLSPTT